MALPEESGAKFAELAAIVENSDDAILSIRLDATIASWNPAAKDSMAMHPRRRLAAR
jgi:hypothetical protein